MLQSYHQKALIIAYPTLLAIIRTSRQKWSCNHFKTHLPFISSTYRSQTDIVPNQCYLTQIAVPNTDLYIRLTIICKLIFETFKRISLPTWINDECKAEWRITIWTQSVAVLQFFFWEWLLTRTNNWLQAQLIKIFLDGTRFD